jgi:hypothetical protein
LCAEWVAGSFSPKRSEGGKGVEFELGEEGFDGVVVAGLEGEAIGFDREREVLEDGGEFFGEEGFLGVLDDLFLLFAFEFVGGGEEVFDGAEFLDEFGGGFFADAGDAGDVVNGVAHEREDIDDLSGAFNAPFGADFDGAEDFDVTALAAGFVDFDVVGDELAKVFVGSDHEGFHAEGVGFFGEDADDVIGF